MKGIDKAFAPQDQHQRKTFSMKTKLREFATGQQLVVAMRNAQDEQRDPSRVAGGALVGWLGGGLSAAAVDHHAIGGISHGKAGAVILGGTVAGAGEGAGEGDP